MGWGVDVDWVCVGAGRVMAAMAIVVNGGQDCGG